MEAADNEESRKVVDFLHAVEQAKQCKSMLEEEKLAKLIALNRLSNPCRRLYLVTRYANFSGSLLFVLG
jgi:hypothetical protein